MVMVDLGRIPGILGMMWESLLDGTGVYCRAPFTDSFTLMLGLDYTNSA